MPRSEKEILAVMRRRNAGLLKWLALFLVFVFAIMATTNYFSAAEKHGPENVTTFLLATSGQSLFFFIIFTIFLVFPRFARQKATFLTAFICPVLLFAQGVMLHASTAHPVMVTLVEYLAFGVLLQFRVGRAAVLFLAIYLIPLAFVATGVTALPGFLVVTIGGPVIATMAVYLQNMLVKQSLTIRENNRALSRNNRQISRLKEEQDQILDTVTDGLFVIDADHRVGSQFSAALPGILGEENPAGLGFPQIVTRARDEDAAEEVTRFLKLMFKPQIAMPSLNEVNPLNEVTFRHASGEEKILGFRFSRIIREKKIANILAAVQDHTEQKQLEAQIAERTASEQSRMKLIFRLVQIEADLLNQFLDEARGGIQRVNALLKDRPLTDWDDTVAEVFQIIHAIKGNASVLELEHFENPAHDFEDAILNPEASAPEQHRELLQTHLQNFQDNSTEVDEMIERLGRFRDAVSANRSPGDLLVATIENLVERLTRELERTVHLETEKLNRDAINADNNHLLRDILVQLVRNSVLHGLEAAEERTAAGKETTGRIEISTEQEGDATTFVLRDDGRGLQLDRIREKAASSGRWSAAELEAFSKGQIANLIFEPGFSTAEKVSLHAGRGVGLDLVKSRLKEAGGSIKAGSRPGQFCEFRITLPS